jgi:heptosyltransferase II
MGLTPIAQPMSPLIVRLPNHLGDACMAVPALDLLAAHGRTLTLVGRPWAPALFSAYPWRVVVLRGERREHIEALRTAHKESAAGVLLTNSLSTALEFRLAGIAATGYARGGRSLLLSHRVPVNASDHMVEYYHRLARAVVGSDDAVPRDLHLRVADDARTRARALLAAAGVPDSYVVLCPVAVGRHHGKFKAWSGFTRLNDELRTRGVRVVAMPGPGEAAAVAAALRGATVLPEADVGTFAALLAGARGVVANDSGPGHLAAAVDAPLVSIFGVTEPEKTRPWSSRTTMVGSGAGWPSYDEVRAAVDAMLAG